MSWESTSHYYRLLNESVRDRLGGSHSADLVIRSFDFAPIADLQHRQAWDEIAAELVDAARALEGAGAQGLLLCTNTMHAVAAQIQDGLSIPLLHIGDAIGRAASTSGVQRIGLLGTSFTMEQPFLVDHLTQRFGVEVVVPGRSDRAMVHAAIYDELVRGILDPATRTRIGGLSHRMRQELGIQGLALACTELELLLGPDDLAVPWFPTTSLHVAAGVDFALSDGATARGASEPAP
jgi:aspartate racemase